MTMTPRRAQRSAARAGAAFTAAALALSSLPLPAQTPARRPAAPAASAEPAAPQPRFRGAPVTLNFVNADIEGVSRAMAAILRQQFIVDPRVRGTITLYSEEPLTPNEAYLNFLAALRGLGFTVVEVGGLFKVVPEADAKLQAGTVSVDGVSRRGDQVITQIFRLNHENANNLVPVLRPLITPNNTINANPGSNSLVITDYADNLQRLAQIIAAMDTPAAGDIEVIPLRYAVAADIQPLLQRLSDGGGPTPATAPGAQNLGTAAPSILVDARSNSLIVRSANPTKMAAVRSLIAKLDLPPQGSATTGNVWVVHLRNADATKLAQVLRAAFGSTGGSSPTGTGGTTTPQPANPAGAAGTATALSAAAAPISASAGPSTGGFIQADPSTNSLVITAAEPLYRQVRAMIDKLDERRAQVYIESLIVEVSGGNTAEFGFQWQGVIGGKGDSNIVIGGTNFGTTGNLLSIDQSQVANGTPTISLGQGLNIGLVKNFFGTYGLAAIANFLQSQANTNIMSTPNLVTLDNEEAKIIVGSNVPFVTGQFTQTGGALTNPFQTIERKDVGITLRIKPQIGENGSIRMTIFQEASSLAADTAPGTSNAGPTTNKRSIESNVMVDDGQILVLGGLIEDRFSDNKSKVPLLGDIPYLGALFRTETRERKRTNLMVFLRPTVLRDAETSNKLSVDRYDLIRSFQQDQQPRPNVFVPINEAPVAPPLQRLEDSTVPVYAPQGLSPGSQRQQARPPPPPEPAAPAPAAPAPVPAAPASAPGG
jgi:general secretion pathway protein D